MNRRLLGWALAMGILVTCGGCTRMGVGTPRALLYSNTTTPMTLKGGFGRPSMGVKIPEDVRVGRATAYGVEPNVPGVPGGRALSVAWGDVSLEAAMADGGLGEVLYGDAHVITVLGIFTKATIEVYGPSPEDVEEPARGRPGGGGPPR